MYRDSILSLEAIAHQTSISMRTITIVPDRSVRQIASDYKSDLGLEIADCQVAHEGMGDMRHNSDEEEISQLPAHRSPSSQDSIPGAGSPLGDVDNYRKLNQTMADDPWIPLSSEADFNLACWLVRNKVAEWQINRYFAEGLGRMDSRSFRSTYTMRQYLDLLDPFDDYVVLTEAEIQDGRQVRTFYYRNVINCVRYLIRKVTYRSDMVYEPIQQYNSSGERLYSAMHTAYWWWETHMNYAQTSFKG